MRAPDGSRGAEAPRVSGAVRRRPLPLSAPIRPPRRPHIVWRLYEGARGQGLRETRGTDLRNEVCASARRKGCPTTCRLPPRPDALCTPLRPAARPRPSWPRRSRLEAATSGVASGTAWVAPGLLRASQMERLGASAAGSTSRALKGESGSASFPSRTETPDLPAIGGLCGLSRGSPGPVASRRPPSRPGPCLRDCFVLAGGGGAEGGSWREPEVGPAAFLGIRWRHSLPPLLRRVLSWELAAS